MNDKRSKARRLVARVLPVVFALAVVPCSLAGDPGAIHPEIILVPEAVSTVALLGLALLGCEALRRGVKH